MLNEIYKKVQNEKSQSINLLRDIVNIESFSGSKSNVDNLSKFLSGKCETLGGKNLFFPQKDFGDNFTSDFYSGNETV